MLVIACIGTIAPLNAQQSKIEQAKEWFKRNKKKVIAGAAVTAAAAAGGGALYLSDRERREHGFPANGTYRETSYGRQGAVRTVTGYQIDENGSKWVLISTDGRKQRMALDVWKNRKYKRILS